MARETKQAKAERALAVIERLDAHMPEAKIELDFTTPLELLVAVILSAQCTDKRVNMVTPELFKRYRSAAEYASADLAELESFIKTCGLFRSKAKNIIAAGQALQEKHGGVVPTSRELLAALPGVGRKTAGVVCIHLGGDDAFPVDTHIKRLAKRLGFSTQEDPDRVELDLRALLPTRWWMKGHQLLIWHGRRTCFARGPECERCVVSSLCPKLGVKKPRSVKGAPELGRRKAQASARLSRSD